MFWHSSKETNGVRAWWHLGRRDHERKVVAVEFYWASWRFGVSLGTDDEGWNLSVRVPPLALYLSLDGIFWQPMRTLIATWDNNRPFTLPDERVCDFYISDWRVQITPWGRRNEWTRADPWWVRGVSCDLRNLVLGRVKYTTEELALVPCSIPMPEGTYQAVAKIERQSWKRPRWFRHTRTSAWLDIPKGIPHAGKGENSYDCGDDGLFGIGGDTIDAAILRAQQSVTKSRQRYGRASEEAMREALR